MNVVADGNHKLANLPGPARAGFGEILFASTSLQIEPSPGWAVTLARNDRVFLEWTSCVLRVETPHRFRVKSDEVTTAVPMLVLMGTH